MEKKICFHSKYEIVQIYKKCIDTHLHQLWLLRQLIGSQMTIQVIKFFTLKKLRSPWKTILGRYTYIFRALSFPFNVTQIIGASRLKLTILGCGADDLVALGPVALLGEGGHLDVVAGECFQPVQDQLRHPGLLAENQV